MHGTIWTAIAVLSLATVANAQTKLAEVPTATANAGKPSDVEEKLEGHLAAWEKAMSKVDNMRVEVKLEIVDSTFNRTKTGSGALLFMKPNCFAARLEREGDYEAFICNGESLYHYNALAHAVTEYKLPVPGKDLSDGEEIPLPAGLDPNDKYVKKARRTFAAAQFTSRDVSLRIYEILSGTNPKALAKRFDISLDKEDANYLYLSIKPISEYDKLFAPEFKVSLLGPKHAFAYSPIQLIIERSDGHKEVWTLSGHKRNSPDIDKASFSYKSLPGFEFRSASGKDPQMPPTKN